MDKRLVIHGENKKDTQKDRKRIFEYLYQFNPLAADKTDDILAKKVNNFSHQPLMGMKRAGTNGRLLIMPEIAMLVAYRIESDDIKVLRVLHMKQKFP